MEVVVEVVVVGKGGGSISEAKSVDVRQIVSTCRHKQSS